MNDAVLYIVWWSIDTYDSPAILLLLLVMHIRCVYLRVKHLDILSALAYTVLEIDYPLLYQVFAFQGIHAPLRRLSSGCRQQARRYDRNQQDRMYETV